MKIYSVHSNPELAHDPERDPVLVEEGFSGWAFLLPLPWALVNRLWLVAIFYVIAALALGWLVEKAGYSGDAVAAAELAMHFLFACEARDLQRWTLRRRGWRDVGVIAGDRLDEAELRWLGQSLPDAAPSKSNPWARA